MQHSSSASKREVKDSNAHISSQVRFLHKGAIKQKNQNAKNHPYSLGLERNNDYGLNVQKSQDNSVHVQNKKKIQPKSAQPLQNHPLVETKKERQVYPKQRSKSLKDKIDPGQGYSKWFVAAMNDLRLQWSRSGPIEPLQAKQYQNNNLVAGTEERKKEANSNDTAKFTINQIEESKSASITINL